MIELDGSDGGGQLVRTALTLSALGGEPFRMEGVRGDRPNPGLKRQHLACVEAAATLTDAEVDGDAVGSETLTFEPTVAPGSADAPDAVAVDVGTAGSVTLVADTLLPLAVRLREPVRAVLTGGTDVRWSPSADYLRRVKLPVLRGVGLDADVAVDRRGFYPAGGGDLDVRIRPSSIDPIEFGTGAVGDGGSTTGLSVRAVGAAELEDDDVAERVATAAGEGLDDRGLDGNAAATATYADADSPGVVLTVVAGDGAGGGSGADGGDTPRAGFVAYGDGDAEPESVAGTAVDAVERWAGTPAPVDEHLADQVVVWLALAGGSVPIPRVTDHVRTNVDLVGAFGYDVAVDRGSVGTPVLSAMRE